MTDRQREFLIGLVAGEPDWNLMQCPHLQKLPAFQWKLQTLAKLKKEAWLVVTMRKLLNDRMLDGLMRVFGEKIISANGDLKLGEHLFMENGGSQNLQRTNIK